MDSRHSFAVIGLGIMESILCHSQTCLAGDDFQTFNNTSHNLENNQNRMKKNPAQNNSSNMSFKNAYLMLKTTIFSFSIFTNCHKVNIIISGLVAWEAVARSDIGVKTKLFP